MKKGIRLLIITLFLSFALFFVGVKSASASSAYPSKAVVVSDVKISGGGRTASYNQVDLYMTSSSARAYAAKMANGTYASAAAWFAAGFIPGIGPYLTGFGFALNLGTHQNVNMVLSAANKYSKVHISVGNSMILSTTKWNGSASSVTPVSSSTSRKTSWNTIITIKVHIDKRVLKS